MKTIHLEFLGNDKLSKAITLALEEKGNGSSYLKINHAEDYFSAIPQKGELIDLAEGCDGIFDNEIRALLGNEEANKVTNFRDMELDIPLYEVKHVIHFTATKLTQTFGEVGVFLKLMPSKILF